MMVPLLFTILLIQQLHASQAESPACSPCGVVTDVAVDYALKRFVSPLTVQSIPNTDIGMGLTMTNTRIYGLNSVHRTCAIKVAMLEDDSQTAKINSCIGANNITLTSAIKSAFPITFFAFITLTKFDLDTEVRIKFVPGSTVQLEDVNVRKMEWDIDFKGALSTFNPLMNAVANGRIGRAAVTMAKSSIKSAIQVEMNKHPL